MERPTINLGLYTWGTTQHPSATYTSSEPADPKSYNADYLKSGERAINTPYNPSGSIITQPVTTLYGWTVAKETIKPFPKSDLKNTDTEYNIKNQLSRVYDTPEPKIIKNFALKMMKKDSSAEPTTKPLLSITNIIEMAQIIADSKIDHPDHKYWVEVLSTLKRLDVLKKQRVLKNEEADIENKLNQIVRTEFQKIREPMVIADAVAVDDDDDIPYGDVPAVVDYVDDDDDVADAVAVAVPDDADDVVDDDEQDNIHIKYNPPYSYRDSIFKVAKTVGSAILEIGRNFPPLEDAEIPMAYPYVEYRPAVDDRLVLPNMDERKHDDNIPFGEVAVDREEHKHDDNIPFGVLVDDPLMVMQSIERGIFPNPEIGKLEQSRNYHYAYPDNIIRSNINLERSQIYEPEVPVDFYHRRFEYEDPDDDPVNTKIQTRYNDEPVKNISTLYPTLSTEEINYKLSLFKNLMQMEYPEFSIEKIKKFTTDELVKLHNKSSKLQNL